MSLKEYGYKRGINYGIMKYWNRQFRIDFPESKKTISKKDAVFIPIEVSGSIKEEVVSKTVPIEVHYPNGVPGATKIGEEITEILEYNPSNIYVRKIVRPKYIFPEDQKIVIGSFSIPKGNAGAY